MNGKSFAAGFIVGAVLVGALFFALGNRYEVQISMQGVFQTKLDTWTGTTWTRNHTMNGLTPWVKETNE